MRLSWKFETYIFLTIVISFCTCQNCRPGEPHLALREDEVTVDNGRISYNNRVYQQGEFTERRGFYYVCQCDISPCIKTCTDFENGNYFPPEKGFKIGVLLGNGSTKDVDVYEHFHVYSETQDCESSLLELDVSDHISADGNLMLGSEISYHSSEFCIAVDKNGKLLKLSCLNDSENIEDDPVMEHNGLIYAWESLISALFLLLSIIAIFVSKETCTVIGKLSVCFCATFMTEQLIGAILNFSYVSSETLYSFSRVGCTAIAFTLLFTGYTHHFWLNAMCLELLLMKRVEGRNSGICRFLGLAFYSTLTPVSIGLAFVIVASVFTDAGYANIQFDTRDICWFLDFDDQIIYFNGPNLVISFFSLAILLTTYCKSELITIKWFMVNILLTALLIFQLIMEIYVYKNESELNVILAHFMCLKGIVVFAIVCVCIFCIRERFVRNSPAS